MSDDPRTTFAARWNALEATRSGSPAAFDATMRSDAIGSARTMVSTPAAHGTWAHPSLPRIPITHSAPTQRSFSDGTDAASGADFQVIAVLGEGGMGRVHLARQRSLGREVALKTLRGDVADAAAAGALLQEARITGGLEHPGIVPVHALGVDEHGYPLLVMKRIDGVAWRDLLRDATHPAWARVHPDEEDRRAFHLEVLASVCNALQFAHTQGVVHRDVKPENVMIGFFGEVYLVDWGIALQTRDGERAASGPAGTPAYMAPEMLAPVSGSIDARTDVYLLGATLHEVLTGRVRHDAVSIGLVLEQVYLSAPVAYGPEVPQELAQLANRATSRDPSDRPASALAFRQALADYERHRGSVLLAQTALRKRAELDALIATRSSGNDTSIARLAGETRFAFAQALAEWSENLPARAGLESLCETLARFELARRNATGARALIDEMASAPAELRTELDALERMLADERNKAAQLDALEHDMDEGVGAGARARLLMALAALGAIVSAVVMRTAEREVTTQTVVRAGALVAGAVVIGSIAFRRKLMRNATSRRLVFLMNAYVLITLFHRVLGSLAETAPRTLLRDDLVVGAAVIAGAAVMHLAWAFGMVAILLIGATLSTVWPQRTFAWFTFSTLLSIFLVAYVSMRKEQSAGESQR